MFKKILIANRGEIACRVIRSAQKLGIATVAVYSDADAQAQHVKLADEAIYIGESPAAQSYLQADRIIQAALATGAQAIHPGYGFLSERAEFAQAVIDAGLKWVGPSPSAIEKLGDKIEARKIAASVGAPLVQGTQDPLNNADEALEFAKQFGLPIHAIGVGESIDDLRPFNAQDVARAISGGSL